ncbi:hypothetical protein HBB16_06200 [Pseudonocardia sp. MCCB 268]|nr:hypothetical protein [Pseudonocardia cytotoxica]
MGAACVLRHSAFLFISSDLTGGVDGMPAARIDLPRASTLVLTVIMVFSVVTGWGCTFEGPTVRRSRNPRPPAGPLTGPPRPVCSLPVPRPAALSRRNHVRALT